MSSADAEVVMTNTKVGCSRASRRISSRNSMPPMRGMFRSSSTRRGDGTWSRPFSPQALQRLHPVARLDHGIVDAQDPQRAPDRLYFDWVVVHQQDARHAG